MKHVLTVICIVLGACVLIGWAIRAMAFMVLGLVTYTRLRENGILDCDFKVVK